MRVISLDAMDAAPASLDADVCIIGAGAAGLYLASRLAKQTGRVVVIEAGPASPVMGGSPGFDCSFSEESYAGAIEGRAFGLGGTTSRWGGNLIPIQPSDAIRSDPVHAHSWQYILNVVHQHGTTVLDVLGVAPSAECHASASSLTEQSAVALRTCALGTACSQWLPFRKRNFARLANHRSSNNVDIYCGAVAVDWGCEQEADGLCRVGTVAAISLGGRRLVVNARKYVIAAGAIESARIVEEIDVAHRVLPRGAAVGQFLSDHLSFCAGQFHEGAMQGALSPFTPRFAGGTMLTWRFIESAPTPESCRYFAHLVLPVESHGFRLVRAVLQGVQMRRFPTISLRDAALGAGGLVGLAWDRGVHSRLHIPRSTPCRLQVDMEQRPDPRNAVRLGTNKDCFGRPTVDIAWRLRERDYMDMQRVRARVRASISGMGPAWALAPESDEAISSSKPHDAYHPTGVCRLGDDDEAVVGLDFKVRGFENVHLLSTGLFPSAGSANPTFSLLCCAEQLACDFGPPPGNNPATRDK